MSKRRGFTLVELMVVVGILGLLLVALMPSFGQARMIARNIRCQSNLHNIYTGMSNYLANVSGSGALKMPDPNITPFPAAFPGTSIDLSNYLCTEDVNATQVIPTPDPNYASVSASGSGIVDNQTLTNNPKNDPVSPGTGLQFGSSLGGTKPVVFTAFAPGFHAVSRRGVDNGRGYWEYAIEDSFGRQATWTGAMNDGIWRVYDPLPGSQSVDLVCVYATCMWKNAIYLDSTNIYQGPFGVNALNLHLDTVRKPGDQSQYTGIATKWKTLNPPATFSLSNIPTNYGVNEYMGKFVITQDSIIVMDFDVLRGGRLIRVNKSYPIPLSVSYNALLSASKRHNGSLNALLASGGVQQFGPNEINPVLTSSTYINKLWGR